MPRFVILEHDHPSLHWDLMLEAGDVLQTWRLAQPPDVVGHIEATALPDHRLLYLDYEGPVSGNRGTVRRWDAGMFAEEAESRAELRVGKLNGLRVTGAFRLEQVDGERWTFRLDY